MSGDMESVNILGVELHAISKDYLLKKIAHAVKNKKKMVVAYLHVKGCNLAYENAWLREFFNHTDIVYCDGVGVRLGVRLLGQSLPERFTLADWMDDLILSVHSAGGSIFFLGNPPGVAEKAAQEIGAKFPGFNIAGAYHGYFDRSFGSAENNAVIERINQSGADVLLVGMGIPVQEKWIKENKSKLNSSVIMAVGGVFEYWGGGLKRAPSWVTDNGLEWLSLLLRNWGRYWRRYLLGNPLFLFRVLRQRWTKNNRSGT